MAGESRKYNTKFYRELQNTRESAREILPIVFDLVKPASIIDVGCGAGHWLAAAIDLGVSDVLGVDGQWAAASGLEIPAEQFLVHDLAAPLRLDRKFDLALSLEVAEHLPASQAESFVHLLCHASDKVLFSAAIPGQGGRHHVNEQWPSYWARLFGKFGFDCYDLLRPRVWCNPRVLWYYAQNSLLFARRGSFNEAEPVEEPLALVHPDLWSSQVRRLNSPGKLLERLPKAMWSALGKRKS